MMVTDIIAKMPEVSTVVDCLLVAALGITGFYMYRSTRALRALRKAQEETPVQIQALIDTLETVRTSVSSTLTEVNVAITEMAGCVAKADDLRDEFTHLTERLQRHIIRAKEAVDEVAQVSAAGDRVADRILECTGMAKELFAPKGSVPETAEDSVIQEEEDETASGSTTEPFNDTPAEAETSANDSKAPPSEEMPPPLAAGTSPKAAYASNSKGRGKA